MRCLCARTRRTARQLTLLYEESLRPAQLTPSQFELMGELMSRSGGEGHTQPAPTQRELAARLALDQTTLSRNLRLLIERGWIEPASVATDRRKVTYTLTDEGKSAWGRAVPLWQAAQGAVEQRLGKELSTAWLVLDRLSEPGRLSGVLPSHTP